MDKHTEKQSLQENILATIEGGKTKMRPKWYFVTSAVFLMGGTLVALVALLFIASFIVFSLHQSGVWFAPSMGWQGLPPLFMSLPWVLIVVAVGFIYLLEMLVRKYSFAYRKPLLYSAIMIVVVTVSGGLIMASTPLHDKLLIRAQEQRLPLAGRVYKNYSMPPKDNISVGRVIDISEDGFSVKDVGENEFKIITNKETRRIKADSDIKVGDSIVIFGKRKGEKMSAVGVQKISPRPMPHRRMMSPTPRGKDRD